MGIGTTLSSPPPVPQPPRLLDQVRGEAASTDTRNRPRRPSPIGASASSDCTASASAQSWVSTRWGNSWSLWRDGKGPGAQPRGEPAALEFRYQDVLHIHLGELPLPRPPRLLDQVRQVLRVRHSAAHGGVLRAVDRALHSFPQQAASAQHGGGGGGAVPERPGGPRPGGGEHAEPGAQRPGVSLQAGARHRPGTLRGSARPAAESLPVVLAPEEVAAVLERIEGGDGVFRVMARLLYGSGLRLPSAASCGSRTCSLAGARSSSAPAGGDNGDGFAKPVPLK